MSELPFKVKALYEYQSPHDDDLNFPNGQIITVTAEEDAEWYYGNYSDGAGLAKEGIFPRNFVERYSPETPRRPTRPPRERKAGPPPENAQVPADVAPELDAPVETHERARVSSTVAPPPSLDDPRSEQPNASSTTTTRPVQVQGLSSMTTKPGLPDRQPAPTQADPVRASSTEKPVSGSFKDRIAAFNKAAAPPVAPSKPAALGGSPFIKKPFVPPPPSRDAYVPPPRQALPTVYGREEEGGSRVSSNVLPRTEAVTRTSDDADHENEEAPAKPTSLKERIARLQQQQLDNALRRAEVSPRRELNSHPAPQRADSTEGVGTREAEIAGDLREQPLVIGRRAEGSAARKNHDAAAPEHAPSSSTRITNTAKPRPPSHLPRSPTEAEAASDGNEADQSGADETAEDTEDQWTEQEGGAQSRRRSFQAPLPNLTPASAAVPDDDHLRGKDGHGRPNAEEVVAADRAEWTGDSEEVDLDPELKRRMELRERMAKMSGGMGMHGMFGVPGGLPRPGSAERVVRKSKVPVDPAERSTRDDPIERDDLELRASQVPVLPTSTKPPPSTSTEMGERERIQHALVIPSDTVEADLDAGKTSDDGGHRLNVEPIPSRPHPAHAPTSPERPTVARGASHPSQLMGSPRRLDQTSLPTSPPVPARAPLVREPSSILSPSAGSESDDERSLHQDSSSVTLGSTALPSKWQQQQPQPQQPPPPPRLSGSMTSPPSTFAPPMPGSTSDEDEDSSTQVLPPGFGGHAHTPGYSIDDDENVKVLTNRFAAARPPSMLSTLRGRPPPPPPPADPPPSRRSTGDSKPSKGRSVGPYEPSEDETTAYEGDYDTDLASTATHKAAIKSQSHEPNHTGVVPSSSTATSSSRSPMATQPSPIPRLPPPYQRSTDPPSGMGSMEESITRMPRTAPPPVPAHRSEDVSVDEDDYDPYRYDRVSSLAASGDTTGSAEHSSMTPPRGMEDIESPSDAVAHPRSFEEVGYVSSALEVRVLEGEAPQQSSQLHAPPLRHPSEENKRYSVPRRSTEPNRSSIDSGYMATDVDLEQATEWWLQPNQPPPVFQNRTDLVYEVEASKTSSRDAHALLTKDVYVLFSDYSQSVITARFRSDDDRTDVSLEQRHEPPPPRMRQDQLETAHDQFGRRIADGMTAKVNNVVGDGSPHTLVHELIKPLAGALMPVGTRAYGAMIYLNLANASVRQYDEIRTGDIISFRHARFQGHRGPMHQKYSSDVGKPDHVGVVVDWDGTKKKVRAWEQGRDGKKVKVESFKLGDLRSGEVKIWRVVGRTWVRWGH